MKVLATTLDLGMESEELIKMLLPFIILQYGFVIYCIIDILRKGTANLTKPIWILLCFFAGLLGPVLYLSVGRRRDI